MIIPDIFQKHGAGHNLTAMAHQIFQQPEFARLQFNLLPVTRHAMAQAVQFEAANLIGCFFR